MDRKQPLLYPQKRRKFQQYQTVRWFSQIRSLSPSFKKSGSRKKAKVLIDDEVPEGIEKLGMLNFTLSYDKTSKTLSVHLIQAKDLLGTDLGGTADPYVRACLLPDMGPAKLTRVHKRTVCPKFNQTLMFQCYSMRRMEELTLCMQVMDYDRFKWDDPIGEILLPLKSAKLRNSPVYWKNLSQCTYRKEGKGEMQISLSYAATAGRLTVGVAGARDLPAKDSNGSSDPYVKIWLVQDGVKIEKRKTATKQCTLSPTFNETFTYDIARDKIDNVQLIVTAMDHDVMTKNDEMGYLVLGWSGTETGRKHWKDMLDKPGYPSAQWHSLCPPKW